MRQFSSAALKNYIRKVDLKPGDCLVVYNKEVFDQAMRVPLSLNFQVPIIVCIDSSVEKATPDQLLSIFEKMPFTGLSPQTGELMRERFVGLIDRIDEGRAVAEGIS